MASAGARRSTIPGEGLQRFNEETGKQAAICLVNF
jgi:hypothetical protein